LNLHNHTWISNDLINKIGYFAKNIEELVLSETDITDDVLKELSISCE
jgi:F-box and leucine-rich repeat protein 2/20